MKLSSKACLLYWAFSALILQFSEAAQLRLNQPVPLGPLQGMENATAPVIQDPLEGCFEVGRSVCMSDPAGTGRTFVFKPTATLPEMEAWYSFDKSLPVDESGHRHHLLDSTSHLAPVDVGPGILGKGASMALDGRRISLVSSSAGMESGTFTVALWLYLTEDSIGSWRTIFNKGSNPDELLPALLLYPDERRLQARISWHTSDTEFEHGVLDSQGLIPLRRWTHLALSSTGGVMRLFINGQLDSEAIVGTESSSAATFSKAPVYIGRDPWRSGVKGYLDDFRWYNRVLIPAEIRSLTFPSLTGIGADFVHLGCKSCTFPEAVGQCKGDSHLCSLQELFAGGFHTARVMGWLPAVPEVWYYNEHGVDLFAGQKKMGLCCRSI
jgi:hypothetical protein